MAIQRSGLTLSIQMSKNHVCIIQVILFGIGIRKYLINCEILSFLELKEIFKSFDKDGDEKINIKDLDKVLLENGEAVSPEDLHTMFNAVDLNSKTF